MNTEQSIRFENLLHAAISYADVGGLIRAEELVSQALTLLRIEIKAAEATK